MIKDLYITGTDFSPEVYFRADLGQLSIKGDSLLENTADFFEEIFDWLELYLSQDGRFFTVNFRLNYFNTGTAGRFFDFLKRLDDYREEQNGEMTINWFYEVNDVNQLENGLEFSSDFPQLFINIIPFMYQEES